MVIAQPYVPRDSLSGQEPYRCTDQAKPVRLQVLQETLAVSRAVAHGLQRTHFTIFPEYSVPGHEGVAAIDAAVQAANWPNGTIVIAGIDGLSRDDYLQLLQGPNTHVDDPRNGSARVQLTDWVNCAITWIKYPNGSVHRWVQPKLYPAWEEQDVVHQRMFRGCSVYMFKGQLDNGVPFRFCTLICFDWIAPIGTHRACHWILSDIHQQAGEHQAPLSWLFVIQRNPKPSHNTFLGEVANFFDQTQHPNALRSNCCLVFANTAGLEKPGRVTQFGATSLVFSNLTGFVAPKCASTHSNGGARFRDGSTLLTGFTDVFFRERGASIFSFAQINPSSLIPGAAGKSPAIDNAHVCAVSGVAEPRAPCGPVAACIKWLNDELDVAQCLAEKYKGVALAADIAAAHTRIIAALRLITPTVAMNTIRLASEESQAAHADDWGTVEVEALQHLVHTVDILSLGAPDADLDAQPAHATIDIGDIKVDLLAVRGSSHEKCIEHSAEVVAAPTRKVLLVSRDPDNTPLQARDKSFLQTETPQLRQERNITDPASGRLHISYAQLLESFRDAETSADLRGRICAHLA